MKTLSYTTSVADITEPQLAGLPPGWPNPPSPATLLRSLAAMNARVLAVDQATGQVAGYVCGMTDGVLILYVWTIEVRPEYQGRGVEEELLRRLIEDVGAIYQINAHPSVRHEGVFAKLGFVRYPAGEATAMTRMRMDVQSGRPK